MTKIRFGKHKGKDIQEVPRTYLEWAVKQFSADIEIFQEELGRRDREGEPDIPSSDGPEEPSRGELMEIINRLMKTQKGGEPLSSFPARRVSL